MKKAIVFALLALMMSAAQGQQFEWAKGYGSTQEGCIVKGSVSDNDGNLYILGQFRNDATWNDELLLPIAPYGYGTNTINTIIAKISPSGEMLWKKVIHSNNNYYNLPYDIKKVGDTAFACLVNVSLPTDYNYCYYLDTLLTSWSEYPIPLTPETTTSSVFTALITFDFSGNVVEQHFIQVSYIDTTGNDYVFTYPQQPHRPDKIFSYYFMNPAFDIDATGNVYICRQSGDHFDDMISVEKGSAIGLKFWVDRQCVGTVYVNDGHHPRWVPQILKFSPHMSELQNSRYVFQKCSNEYNILSTYTKVDRDNNVYHMCTVDNFVIHEDTLIVDSSQYMKIMHSNINRYIGCMICYNGDLFPRYCVYLKDSIMGNNPPTSSMTNFCDLCIDHDSSMVFISGYVQKNRNASSRYTYRNNILPIEKNDAFILSLNKNTGIFKSCSVIPSLSSSNLGTWEAKGNLFAKNNRILIQNQYYKGMLFPAQTIQLQDNYAGLCLTMFDYSGNIIGGIDYNAIQQGNRPGPIENKDSVLYLANSLVSGATFGDINVPESGYSACIAKYVNPAFMTPYVYTGPSDVRIVLVDDGEGAFVVYPNPFRSSVKIKVDGGSLLERDGAATATLTDMQGRQEQVRLTTEEPSTYRLDLSTTRIFRQSGNQAIFLTLTTSAGKQHTVRLLQQADLFGD